MEFGVLGAVTVRVAGADVVVRRKPLELLAVLLTEPNRPQSGGALADRLWRERPPPTADAALRVHLTALRTAVRPPGSAVSRLGRTPAGYVLTVEPDELDAERFDRDVRRAEELAPDRPTEAADILEAAMASWRGEPFAGVEDIAVVDLARHRLRERHHRACLLLADVLLAQGRHADVAERALHWLAEHPTSEQLAARRVEALYGGGDQVSALRAWRQFAHHLVEDYGLDPTPEFRALERRVLEHAVEAPDRLTDRRPRRSPLVERQAEVDAVTAALEAPALDGPAIVVVSGSAGLGKSALLGALENLVGGVLVTGEREAAPLAPIDELIRRLGGRRDAMPNDEGILHGQIVTTVLGLLDGARPPILVDDIDACDADSVEVMRGLLRAGLGPWITSSRRPGLDAHPLLTDRRTLASAHSIVLGPLSSSGIAALLERATGRVPDPTEVERYVRSTAGNPFLVIALSRTGTGGEWTAVPDPAVEHVRRLVAEIGPDAVRWFEVAAIDATPGIDVELAGRITAIDPERSIEIAEAGLGLGVLHDEQGALAFRHAIAHEAVLHGLSGVRRRDLHRRMAGVLLAAGPHVRIQRLAAHLRAADADDLADVTARSTALEAEGAMTAGGVLGAATLFELAGTWGERAGLPAPEMLSWSLRRCDALTAAGRLGDVDELAAACAATARHHDARDLFVAASIRLVGPVIPTGDVRDIAEASVVEALEWCAVDRVPIDVRLAEACTRVVVASDSPVADRLREVVRPVLEAASERADRSADRVLAELGLRTLGFARNESSSARLTRSAVALAASERVDDPWLRLRCHRAHVVDCFAAADARMGDVVDRYRREAVARGSSFHAWSACRIASAWCAAAGADDEAGAHALAAVAVEAAVHDPHAVAAYVADVVAEHVRTRRLAELASATTGPVDVEVAADGRAGAPRHQRGRRRARAAHPDRGAAGGGAARAVAHCRLRVRGPGAGIGGPPAIAVGERQRQPRPAAVRRRRRADRGRHRLPRAGRRVPGMRGDMARAPRRHRVPSPGRPPGHDRIHTSMGGLDSGREPMTDGPSGHKFARDEFIEKLNTFGQAPDREALSQALAANPKLLDVLIAIVPESAAAELDGRRMGGCLSRVRGRVPARCCSWSSTSPGRSP